MRLIRDPYFGEQAKKREKITKLVLKDRFPDGYYGIVLRVRYNRLEIHPPLFLKQAWFDRSEDLLVGLASTKEEAENLVSSILTEAYRDGMLGDLAGFLAKKEAK